MTPKTCKENKMASKNCTIDQQRCVYLIRLNCRSNLTHTQALQKPEIK